MPYKNKYYKKKGKNMRVKKHMVIEVVDPETKINLWGKIKMHIWNFILPPHLRLKILDYRNYKKLLSKNEKQT